MIILGVGIGVLVVVLIGLSVARKVDGDSTNFLVAGRSLALPLTAAGLMGQAVDTNATLGNTDLSASFGFWSGASLPIGLAVCLVITGVFFAKRMNAMKLLTIGDFFRRRYGRVVELVASIMMIFSFCILLAGNLVADGFLFERFLGTSYAFGVLLIVGVVLLYTATGGMYSDAYTAFAQMVITMIATLSLLVWVGLTYGITIPDGMGPFDLGQLTSADQGAMFNWATLLALGIGDIVAIDFMQRIFAARSPQTAQRACFVGALGVLVVGIPFSLVALSSGAIIGDGPVSGPVLFTLLDRYAPVGLTILVLSGIVAASCSTANGAILGTAAVAARNVAGVQLEENAQGKCRLLRATRITLLPVVAIAVLFALRVPETGILLTLAFDVMLAALAFPFIFGHYWSRASTAATVAAIAVGSALRIVFFVLTPTVYGVPNTLLYVPNSLLGEGFDGWATVIAAAASLGTFVAVALARRPGWRLFKSPQRRATLYFTTANPRWNRQRSRARWPVRHERAGVAPWDDKGVLRWITAGESHGPALVAVLEGMAAGVEVTSKDVQAELARRRLGHGRGARMKFEADEVDLLGGVRHGRTLGGPIAIRIGNTEWPKWETVMAADPVDPDVLAAQARNAPLTRPRPGHADLAGMTKYGFDDARPVLERASARETAARVALGTVAKAFLRQGLGVEVLSHVVSLGAVDAPAGMLPAPGDLERVDASPVRAFTEEASAAMTAEVDAAKRDGDTLGGVVEVVAHGLPVGLGSFVHSDRRLDARLAGALMGIQAMKGVEIGDGFTTARRRGSAAHDEMAPGPDGVVRATNRAGGLEGGMTNGEVLRVRVAMKPISTVPRALATVDVATGEAAVAINQRSDVCAVPAAGVVAEAMVALVLADAALEKFGGDSLPETVRNVRGYLDSS